MKAGDAIVVDHGWVSFGPGLALRTELIQAVEVAPAAAANVPEGTEAAWFQLEVKYAPRSAPYVVYVGNERCCRGRAGRLVEDLRASKWGGSLAGFAS